MLLLKLANELRIDAAESEQATVEHLAGLLQLGMASGVFENREPSLAAGTALAMVNAPNTLFHSGKLVDSIMRDRMIEEVFFAIMNYLKKKQAS